MEGQARKKIRNDQRQRALRRNATDTEHKLWESLRSRQIDGAKFRRQHPFGDYILDFACLERRVVVELDGGQHAETTRYDRERTRVLERAGFTLLRFRSEQHTSELQSLMRISYAVLFLKQKKK